MVKISIAAIILSLLVISISVVKSIDQSPESVEKWLQELGQEKVTKLHFFLHETSSGENATTYPVAQPNISLTSPTLFGRMSMIDDPLKEGPEPDSAIVGAAQGLNSYSSLEETSLIMTLNFVFTNEIYNGSTISVLGRNPLLNQYRELAIVGGSGIFRLARGIVTTQTREMIPGRVIAEYNLLVIHY